ncbi:hypothetical protein EGW08_020222, partial [Elysia chlorotica]
SEQLKHEDAQRPVVRRDVVALVQDDFWSHVLRRPTERPGLPPVTHSLSEAKKRTTHQLDVPGRVEQKVLRFEIPVDDPTTVQVDERLHH